MSERSIVPSKARSWVDTDFDVVRQYRLTTIASAYTFCADSPEAAQSICCGHFGIDALTAEACERLGITSLERGDGTYCFP